jgi:uncharacterized membrane protein
MGALKTPLMLLKLVFRFAELMLFCLELLDVIAGLLGILISHNSIRWTIYSLYQHVLSDLINEHYFF